MNLSRGDDDPEQKERETQAVVAIEIRHSSIHFPHSSNMYLQLPSM